MVKQAKPGRKPNLDLTFIDRIWASHPTPAIREMDRYEQRKEYRPFRFRNSQGVWINVARLDRDGRLYWRISESVDLWASLSPSFHVYTYVRNLRFKKLQKCLAQVSDLLTEGKLPDTEAEMLLDLLYFEISRRVK